MLSPCLPVTSAMRRPMRPCWWSRSPWSMSVKTDVGRSRGSLEAELGRDHLSAVLPAPAVILPLQYTTLQLDHRAYPPARVRRRL